MVMSSKQILFKMNYLAETKPLTGENNASNLHKVNEFNNCLNKT